MLNFLLTFTVSNSFLYYFNARQLLKTILFKQADYKLFSNFSSHNFRIFIVPTKLMKLFLRTFFQQTLAILRTRGGPECVPIDPMQFFTSIYELQILKVYFANFHTFAFLLKPRTKCLYQLNSQKVQKIADIFFKCVGLLLYGVVMGQELEQQYEIDVLGSMHS